MKGNGRSFVRRSEQSEDSFKTDSDFPSHLSDSWERKSSQEENKVEEEEQDEEHETPNA